jgi:exodeoxyribonuclease VII small subunit
MTEKEKPASFEESYARLEQILEKMNSGKISLDDSLKLYEEADGLITSCQIRLQEAERKIEILIKNRSGELLLNENGKPVTQEFERA